MSHSTTNNKTVVSDWHGYLLPIRVLGRVELSRGQGSILSTWPIPLPQVWVKAGFIAVDIL
jgi:hypothetical protein